jgi:hypothetical protein
MPWLGLGHPRGLEVGCSLVWPARMPLAAIRVVSQEMATPSRMTPTLVLCLSALPSHPALGFSYHLLHRLQERFTGENNLFPTLDKPPLPDDPLLIDQEECPLGDRKLGKRGVEGQAAILPGHP